ncbi:MAG: four-carbon acid sugar kinase family protein [Bryobacteraceae bacterium]|nr:four-carbon acid sugar kinase family protein [Bryobacteraceae bacterium]
MRPVAIADDATGALEVGATLAKLGIPARVTFDLESPLGDCVTIFDTESRHLPDEAAAERVRSVALRANRNSPLYKKIDSTLRGPIAAELAALAETFPDRPIALIPAYPALGRTVRQGRVFVHGVPLEQTAFARDPRLPVHSSEIAGAIDAETDADLDRIAASLHPATIVAGSGGFVSRWAKLVGLPTGEPPPLPKIDSWLLICGSRHPTSLAQAEAAPMPKLLAANTGSPEEIAAELAARAAREIERTTPDAVLIFGGDTAFALWQALHVREIAPLGEALPGVAISTAPGHPVFVTKAGGFGDPALALTLVEKFRR